jgi:hypothetical protein
VNCLLLGVFLYLAYLPLSSFLFAVKNDALTQNFPHKYFFSAALHSGFLPLWNPYVNFGLPLYADPGFAFWQPLTWLFGFIGYSVHMLAIELLVYIWLGGIFMYRLGLFLGHSRLTALILGMLYMCCGFFIGNLAHTNFLTCAAFLPLVTLKFLKLQASFSPGHLLQTTLACYLLAAGGHPAIPIGALYFFATILVAYLITARRGTWRPRQAIRTNLLLLLAVLGLTAPIFLSWSEIWPFFNRCSPVFQSDFQDLGFTLPSYLSFLFPFATTARSSFFGTDPSMRNGYISFIGLALFLVALTGKKNRLQITFLIGGIVMLLLSLGAPVKNLLYSNLPLLRLIRTNGEYRVFALFSFILVLSWPLEALLKQGDPKNLPFSRSMAILGIIALVTLGFSAPFVHFPAVPSKDFAGAIKSLLDGLGLPTRLFINAALLVILISVYFLLRKTIPPGKLIPALLTTDLLLFCWMHLPVTGVQRRSASDIESLYASVAPGIPQPRLSPIADNTRSAEHLEKIIGCWSYYSKQPGTPELCNYPTLFTATEDYFRSALPDSLNKRPFLFIEHAATLPDLIRFSPENIEIRASSPIPDTLVLMQNDFPGWRTTIDGRPIPHIKVYRSFIGIPFDGSGHLFTCRFTGPRLYWYLGLALLTIAVLYGWCAVTGFRQRRQVSSPTGSGVVL